MKDEAMGDKTRLQMEWDVFLVNLSKGMNEKEALRWARTKTRFFCAENGLFKYYSDSLEKNT